MLKFEFKDGDLQMSNDDPDYVNPKEKVYDKIPLSVKQLDIIIVLLIIAFFVFFALGALKGNGII